jgi:4-carboxymuconolactone decarboxylase
MTDDGMKTRREVLGDEHVDRAIASTTEFTADFQDLITRYAWGEIWTRPGLDRKTRSCITLAALVALGRDHELALHVRAALRNGLTPDEIKEVLLHCAVYCGVPAANSAFAIAQQVLDEERGSGVGSTEPPGRRRRDGAGQGAQAPASPGPEQDARGGAGLAGSGADE